LHGVKGVSSIELPATNWINGACPGTGQTNAIRLFCFPHAGGGASVFRPWTTDLAPDINVYPVQLPGREGHWRSPPVTRISALVPALSEALRPFLQPTYVFFGHSMGAFVAFELARQLRRENRPAPAALIVSAARAPQIRDPDPPIHMMPTHQLLENLRRLDGIPKELLDHPDLIAALLPTMRADLAMCETYEYRAEPPLSCPISVYGAEHDEKVPLEHLAPWRVQTSGDFQLRVFPGGHFFHLKEARRAVTQALRHELPQYTSKAVHARGLASSIYIEQVIADIWRDVLSVPQVGLDDNFFDIGGNSLLMVQAYVKLRTATSTSLSVLDLFRYPTVRLLAGAIGPAGVRT
jgi:medium-chain acyl-[acyl-carrier-protein] hydrolase